MSNIFDRKVSSSGELSHPEIASEMDDAEFLASDETVKSSDLTTPTDVKVVTQESLKHGYIEEARKSELFRFAIGYEREILAVLEPLDLEMRSDAHRGVAFLVVARTRNSQRCACESFRVRPFGHCNYDLLDELGIMIGVF